MASAVITEFRVYRFQFRRDRVIGDSQASEAQANVLALELIDASGRVGLGFAQVLFRPTPDEGQITKIFATEAWPSIEGREPGAIALQVTRPRGGTVRRLTLPFEESIQQATWDLLAKSLDLPLWKLLGARRQAVPVYASGLDFWLSDHEFTELFGRAAALGYRGFKVKVGHPDLERDLHRLDLLRRTVGRDGAVMIDANEAWTAQEAVIALQAFARAGHVIYWAEDPVFRNDAAGLRLLRHSRLTRINSGEYLDLAGKRRLLEAGACDVINVHGHVSDALRAGWLAADANVEVAFGNTVLEVGVNMALALPGVHWLEYSFRNFAHLVEEPFAIRDGLIYGSETPGHGLVLSSAARSSHRCPIPLGDDALGPAPACSHEPPDFM